MALYTLNVLDNKDLAIIGGPLVLSYTSGTPDYINGAYITTLTTVSAGGVAPPNNTTLNPSLVGSSAELVLPPGSTISQLDSSYLCWITSSAATSSSVLFMSPNQGAPLTINAERSETAGTLTLHAADIRPYIANVGLFTVTNLPGPTMTPGSTQSALAWWAVLVVDTGYGQASYISGEIGLNYISSNATNYLYQFPSSFKGTPYIGTASVQPKQSFLSTYSFGNLDNGSQLSIGTTTTALNPIGQVGAWDGNTPYISRNNAVGGNILIADSSTTSIGLLNTRGTLGTYNKNPFPGGATVPFARTNLNIMGVNAVSLISYNQPTLYTNTLVSTPNTFKGVYNTGNFYVARTVYPDIDTMSISVNKSYVKLGDTITYTVRMPNTGTGGPSVNTVLTSSLGSQVSLVPGSIKINGVTSLNANLSGLPLADIQYNEVTTVTFDAVVQTTLPALTTISSSSRANYSWVPYTNIAPGTYNYNTPISYATTTIVSAVLNSSKTVNKNYVGLNTVLTYTIPIKNTGNTTTNLITLIDTVPSGTTFVANSLKQDNTTITSGLLASGVTLANIGPGVTSTVTFNVNVVSVPSTGKITNSATTSFNYVVDSTTTPNILGYGYSYTNIVSSTVSSAVLSILKSSNKAYATLGDVLTYTLAMSNSGNATATSIVLLDTIPTGTTFVPNSLKQDGNTISGNPNPPGISLNNIGPNTISTVSYQVSLTSIPSINPIINGANVSYSFTIDNTTTPNVIGSGVFNTNVVTTTFNYISLSSSKIVDKDYTDLYGVLTFTIPITNNGTSTTNMLVFIDTIPAGASLIPNTLKQDGSLVGGTPNPPGVLLSNIGPGSTSTVSFNVSAYTIPSSGKIVNSATTSFNYVIDPTTLPLRIGYGFTNTNVTSTTISHADLGGTKIVDKSYSTLRDILTYTIPITNTGTATATNVVFLDTTPSGLVYIPGSLKVNGVSTGGDPNPPGAPLSNIGLGSTAIVSYQVMIATVPSINPIVNSANVQYSYVVDPLSVPPTTGSDSLNTNIVSTVFNYTSIVSTKTVSKNYSDINTTITYTLPLFNSGNVTANNVVLIDTIPAGATFVPNSLMQDGISSSGSPNPPGVLLSNIRPNTVSTVSFEVLVSTIPTSNKLVNSATTSFTFTIDPSTTPNRLGYSYSNTNIVTTTVLNARLASSKAVNLGYATFNNVLTYTIPIANTGNTTADNIVFSDTIPYGLNFVPGSFTQNGSVIAGNPNPPGVVLNSIGPNSVSTIVFNATVVSIPSTNTVKNSATTTFNYIIDPSTTPNLTAQSSSNTNIVTTTISVATFGSVTIASNYSFATCDDIITFTVSIPNTGNTTAYNVAILDTIPNGMSFVSNSVTINGVTIPSSSPIPPGGINVGTIPAGAYYIVTFKLQVNC